MRIKNKSLRNTAYVYLLGNLKIAEDTTINVPLQFTEAQVREAISPFPDLILLDGYVVNQDDILDGKQLGHDGIMIKDVYDANLNNIVDEAEVALSGGNPSIELDFTYSDFIYGSLDIGILKANLNIEEIKLIIDNPFDVGSITVGDAGDNSRLMTSTDNDVTYASSYIVGSEYVYPADTTVKIYFTGNPITGSGKIVIFSS